MSRPINIQETLTFVPALFDQSNSTYDSINASYPASNALTNSNSTTYAQFNIVTGSGAETFIYYNFDTSNIPANATINSVTCSAKVYINTTNSNRITARQIQLFSGNTAKGSASTFSNSTNVITMTPGSWTVSELRNARIRAYVKRGTSNTTTAYYVRIYGATLSVNYSISGTEYEIVSTLATNAVDSIDPAGQTWIFGGDSYVLNIFADSSEGIEVIDNGVDVTEQLVLIHSQSDSSTYTCIPASYDSVNSDYASTYTGTAESALAPYNGSNRFCVYVTQTAYAEAKLVYNFDCTAIPQNAIITSVTCKAGAACFSNGQYFDIRTVQLYSGNTAKGTATTITGNGGTNTEHNINGGSWTRAELDNAKIVIYIQRGNNTTQASFSFWGATLSVSYTIPEDEYYTYTLTNVSADHTIIVGDSIIEIPDEDPSYNYYPITISSINATTEPGRGTVRVVEGSNQTITIYPDDPSVTLVTDNGVDISNQMVQHGGVIPDPIVTTASGASYGFSLNNSTGYYVSQNTGVDKSAAVCVVHFNLPVRCLVTIQYINYAEATYDFGIFGNIDVPLNGNYKPASGSMPDSSYKLACNASNYNSSSVQIITYEIPSGEHDIYIKYSKDDATSENNDTLQFKISDIQELETNNYYTYTLSNIQEPHSLIFIFGDVTYYFVNSSGTNARLFPSGQMVQLPGDTYRLTVIPDDYSYNIAVTDNNVDVTNNVQKKEEEITKEGVTITVVNYIYTLNNIAATHNIVVSCFGSGGVYVKVSDSWVTVSKIYKKQNNAWVEQSDISNIFETGKIYINDSH